jgi:outer membrane immunogenic protein
MKLEFATALIAWTLTSAIAPASAADIPVKAPKAPPAAIATWTGCYLGGNGGYGWAKKEYEDRVAVPPEILGQHHADGGVGGGQVGCDYQSGNWLFGVQGMFDGAHLRGRHLVPGDADVLGTRISWLATATARVGWVLQPNALFYVKGGGAWVRDKEDIVDLGVLEARADVTRTGWTVGFGGEIQWWSNVSVFAEYDYLGFGRRNVIYTNLEVPPVPPTFPLSIRQEVHLFLAGINYRFNVPGAVTARY